MTRFVLITLCILSVTIHLNAQSCGAGETEDDCPAHDHCYQCPTREGQYNNCQKPAKCGQSKCKCGFNMKKAIDGTCISTYNCPPFKCDRPNEEYVACPPLCPTDDCKQSSLDGRCPFPGRIGIVVECNPACRCRSGYWRKNGTCVPYNECPQRADDSRQADDTLPIFFRK